MYNAPVMKKVLTSIIGKNATAITLLHRVVDNAPATPLGVVKDARIKNKGTKDAKIVVETEEHTLEFDPIDTVEFNENRITFERGGREVGIELTVFVLNFD